MTRRSWQAGIAVAIVIGGLATYAFNALAADAFGCSASLTIHGRATVQQVELVKCYLVAIENEDTKALQRLSDNGESPSPLIFDSSDFAHGGDAKSGRAVARFVENPADSADVDVEIVFADGARKGLELHVTDPEFAMRWRIVSIGHYKGDG